MTLSFTGEAVRRAVAVGAPALDAAKNATGEEGLQSIAYGFAGEREEEGQREYEGTADWYTFSGFLRSH